MRTSPQLKIGEVYTRAELMKKFSIKDATIRTGVFRPKETTSIWLFVTKNKTSDRTQYVDEIQGDYLHWDGQTSGRTDQLIATHKSQGLEIMVFYRNSKAEYSGAGFVYEGIFEYISHEPGAPSKFLLKRLAT